MKPELSVHGSDFPSPLEGSIAVQSGCGRRGTRRHTAPIAHRRPVGVVWGFSARQGAGRHAISDRAVLAQQSVGVFV
jgi:hypothetical protein